MKQKGPTVIKVSDSELKKLKNDIQNSNLSDAHKKIVLTVLETYYWLAKMYEAKKLSLLKIKRLFGFKTEKPNKKEKKSNNDVDNQPKARDEEKSRPKGRGKNGKNDFPGADKVFHEIKDLNRGDLCPACLIGKVYPVKPGIHIQFTGHSPLQATIHETEKLRCNACGKYFEAFLPEDARKKFHPSSDVVIAIQKYALGLPFYRTGKWQNDMGVPLSPSSQWERCEVLVNSVFPVYEKLLDVAAEGELFHGDDTKNKILDVQKDILRNKEKRTGIYTTAVVSKFGERIINLFFTGRKYCGENLDFLLERRKSESQVILMSDALKMNIPKKNSILWANCLTHSRRNFWDYREKYPKMVTYVLFLLGQVYKNDKQTKSMSPNKRMEYHNKHSGPVLEKIRRWGIKKLYQKKIEPNEELGQALKYYFKHYKELTLFLRIPGVPIDNSIVERLLKTPILNRKNAYFFKTAFGALVGDIFMSLVATCRSSGINPQNYLQTLHEHKNRVKKSPKFWLPWNFKANFSS